MYPLLFIVAFSANISLAIYLVANEKTHAQPWRFLVAAIATILLAYGFELAASFLNSLMPKAALPELDHLVKLTNLICGAFSGALASVAVTNRAKLMHDKKTDELRIQFQRNEETLTQVLGELKGLMSAGGSPLPDPGDASLLRSRTDAVSSAWVRLELQREAYRKEMRKLGIAPKE